MTTPTPRRVQRYGWVPDLPDHRDQMLAVPAETLATQPSRVDLREHCPQVYDQGQLGSCTANAIAGAFEYDLLKQGETDFMPSRLFIYYNERVIEGTIDSDAGAMIRDGMKTVHRQGVCAEDQWPYDISRFTDRPTAGCYEWALAHHTARYRRLWRTLGQLKGCMAAGLPFVFGFTVYESFESDEVARTGIVPMPESGERVLGGHAVLAVGYDNAAGRFLVRNSWGTGWGEAGYCTMPYAYLLDPWLASDFWAIDTVS